MAGKHLDKNNLGYLGIDFQYKLAKIFVEDSKFFEDVAPIVDQNAFNDSLLRTFIGTLKDYYSRESVIPSYEMLNVILREKAKTNNELEEADELIKKLKFETSLEGYIFVKDVALKFFKQQNLIRVANKILDIAGKGDIDRYEECQKLLDDAAMAGQEDDFGYDIYQLQDKALANDYTVSIPTGIDTTRSRSTSWTTTPWMFPCSTRPMPTLSLSTTARSLFWVRTPMPLSTV